MSNSIIVNNEIIANATIDWPDSGLDFISACPVCNVTERIMLHKDLVDNVFFCAPGKWDMWKCSGCESAYLDPRPSQDSIYLAYKDYYTHLERVHKDEYSTLPLFRKLRRRLVNGYASWQFGAKDKPANIFGVLVAFVIPGLKRRLDRQYRHLPKLPSVGGSLLDVGCGDGSFLELALNCGWNATGIDFDPEAVANASKRGLEVYQGGVEIYEGKCELYDVITLNHVIEHVHEPSNVLKTCYRLLKPGGRLWLETPNIESLGHKRFQDKWRGLEPPRHLVVFNRESLRQIIQSADFRDVITYKVPSACAVMYQASINMENQQSPYELQGSVKAGVLKIIMARLHEFIVPACAEFITISASKPGANL